LHARQREARARRKTGGRAGHRVLLDRGRFDRPAFRPHADLHRRQAEAGESVQCIGQGSFRSENSCQSKSRNENQSLLRLMQRKRVNSSKLRSVGYDEATKTLEVEMSNGQVYQYVGVYPEVYRRFMAAPNPTSFFDDKIEEEYTGRRV